MVETKSTGWKSPQGVTQKYKDVNGKLTCYQFVDLNDIKKDDLHYAYIPYKGGIDINHKSPILYAYNYGFNIPTEATITKISLLAIVNQLSHPNSYYQNKLYKKHKKYFKCSLSKWCQVQLRVGTTDTGGEIGNNMYNKSGSLMLPYKSWTTSTNGVFSGTPTEWGLSGDDIVQKINNGGFGIAVQFVGTLENGWCNPGVAKLQLNVEYTLPSKPDTTPTVSEFTKLTVKCGDTVVNFDSNNTASIGNLERDSNTPLTLTFIYTHKGLSGETPLIQLKSSSLTFGSSTDSKTKGTTVKNSFTLSKLHCDRDDSEKTYSHNVMIFAGLLLNEQTITFDYQEKTYTLKVNVIEPSNSYSESFKARFSKPSQRCMIHNCLFYRNLAGGTGGASVITSELYDGKENMYGTGDNTNVVKDANGKTPARCVNVLWGTKCATINSDGVETKNN